MLLKSLPVVDLLGFMDYTPEGDRPSMCFNLFYPCSPSVCQDKILLRYP